MPDSTGYVGADATGSGRLAAWLEMCAADVERLGSAVEEVDAGLALDGTAGPRAARRLDAMAVDDRAAAAVVRSARDRLAGFGLESLLVGVARSVVIGGLAASLLSAPWRRWSTLPPRRSGGRPAVGLVTVDGDDGDDRIGIRVDGDDVVLEVDGGERRVPLPAVGLVVVRAGAGRDALRVAAGVDVPMLVLGGDGDDDLRLGRGPDVVYPGPGADYVDAGRGDDTVIAGAGTDVVYGMGGDDLLAGAGGDDHLEGAAGHDVLWGGSGHDVVSGGEGHERIVLIGTDHLIDGPAGSAAPRPGWSIAIDGDAGFVERVSADLVALGGTASGRALLAAIDAASEASRRHGRMGPLNIGSSDGNRVTVVEIDEERGSAYGHSDRFAPGPRGEDATVELNPGYHVRHLPGGRRVTVSGPPLVVLFHELVHAWTFQTDRAAPGSYHGPGPDGPGPDEDGVPNLERQAVGLSVDHDGSAATPDRPVPGHPPELTENAFRAELGLATRRWYRPAASAAPASPAASAAPASPAAGDDSRAAPVRRRR